MLAERMRACEDRDLRTRMVAEYLEMPGLNLTVAQAARLWDIDINRCATLLESLHVSGFLRKSGNIFVRATVGCQAA